MAHRHVYRNMLLSKVSGRTGHTGHTACLGFGGAQVTSSAQVASSAQCALVLWRLGSFGALDHLVLWIGDWSDLDAWMGLAGDLAESLAGTLQGPCRGLEGHSESLGSRELGRLEGLGDSRALLLRFTWCKKSLCRPVSALGEAIWRHLEQ